jgi:uncharacterized membrane protein
MPPEAKARPAQRIAYIDWMRGLACVLMFQTHCYDSWLTPANRQTTFFMYSQLGGTFPAPLFLFLAGISFALVTQKLRQKNLPAGQIARTTIWRGTEIFGYGLLFRLQEYVVSFGWAPKSDLLRVDILNTIGLSLMLMGVMCWVVAGVLPGTRKTEAAPSFPRSLRKGWETGTPAAASSSAASSQSPELRSADIRGRLSPHSRPEQPNIPLILAAAGTALLISLLTPLLYTTWRPTWLPWPIESYIDGVHNLGVPVQGLFPVFPWTGFAFAGLAVGFILQTEWARAHEARIFFSLGAAGAVLIELARWLDRQPRQIYPVYNYWLTSPQFFLIRVGMLLVIMTGVYVWCRWVVEKMRAAQWGFSPVIQLGQASLLVYWVHIEFVYGRVSILPKHAMSIGGATAGLLVITLAMLVLAYIRTHAKGWRKRVGPGGTADSSPPVSLAGGVSSR